MSREIKFRGKRLDYGEWTYGSLLILTTGHYIVPIDTYYNELTDVDMGEKIILNALWEHNDFHKVVSETVGQYTGLKDKNSKEIYEGDVVNLTYGKWHKDETGITRQGKVIWDVKTASFKISIKNSAVLVSFYDINSVEVISNIYENPELLLLEVSE